MRHHILCTFIYHVAGHFSASTAGTLLLPGIASAIIGGFVGGAILKRGGATGFSRLALGSYPLVAVACAGVALGAGLIWTQSSVVSAITVLSTSLFIGGLEMVEV